MRQQAPNPRCELARGLAWAMSVGLWLAAPALAAGADLLVDRAAEIGIDFVHFNGMSGELYFSEMVGSGVALLDYDGDGDLDVYFVQGHMLGEKPIQQATFPPHHPLPLGDRLYRNDLALGPDGGTLLRFIDVTQRSGIRAHGYGMGVAAGDIDNNGWVDLYVTNAGPNQMFRNNGDGTFSDVTAEGGTGDRSWGVSAAFLDYDRDGWLDLYVGNYVDFRVATDKECFSETGVRDYCGPLSYARQPDRLYRNRGDGSFEDATSAAGVSYESPSAALGVVASDFNGDGWLDIYVANDAEPNFLWLNQRDGSFRNEALLAGCAVSGEGYPEASMGVVVADLNGDGTEDLFMSHLARETNTFYVNDGTGIFVDASLDSGLGIPSWQYTGFGVGLLDYDLDGWLDLFIANGAVKLMEELSRKGDIYPLHQSNQLFRNLGDGRFQEVSESSGDLFILSEVSRGVAVGDIDHDGDPDLVFSNNAGPARLAENRIANGHAWVGVDFGPAATRGSLQGTRVALHTSEGESRWRRFSTDGSYASSHDPRVLLGLGEGRRVHRLQVIWPAGGGSEWRDLPSNTYVTFWRSPADEESQ